MLRERPVPSGPADGGLAARRVLARWAWRLLRREWRQQLLIVALLVLTVAAATFSVATAYNVASRPGPQFGSADYLLQFTGPNQATIAADVAAAKKAFGTIQVIDHQFVTIPGSTQTAEYRAMAPDGPFSGPMLALDQGRFPAGPGQVAITSGLAQSLQVHVGSVLTLPGHRETVTGIVENPSDLNDQFILVPPSAAGPPQEVTVLLDASPDQFAAFTSSFQGPLISQQRGADTQGSVAAGALGGVAVLLMLVSLVAAAAFTVIAARRQRQLAMLAAIGATRRQVRTVMVVSGMLAGAIAAVAGVVVGLLAWFVTAPHLESFAGHRIDQFAVPWDLVVLGMVLAVITAAAAAWWPAWTASRVPVVNALSSRPLKPSPAHRPAIVAVLLIAASVVCLTAARQTNGPLIILGALLMILGIVLISPLSIRMLSALAGRAPVAARLALRDLGRYQARSGAALAAISLALGIAAAIMISAAADKASADTGNLPGNQVLVWIGQPDTNHVVPVRTSSQLSALGATVQQIAGSFSHAVVIPLEMPVNPVNKVESGDQQPVVSFNAPANPSSAGRNGVPGRNGVSSRTGVYTAMPLYVATPGVLNFLGINPGTIDPATDVLTVHSGEPVLTTISTATNPAHVQVIHAPAYSSDPTSLITLNGLSRYHWTQIQSGWLIQSSHPLTAAQLAAAQDVAAKAGLVIESRNNQASLGTISTVVTVAGALIALGVLAMAVGLIRTEAAGEVRTLTAIGATSGTRRALTATTAGALALLGALLGSAAAYLALAAGHRSNTGVLGHVPVLDLTVIIVVVPLVAAAVGWLLSGRKPDALARQALD
jgi:putative ABC transport system permease protein